MPSNRSRNFWNFIGALGDVGQGVGSGMQMYQEQKKEKEDRDWSEYLKEQQRKQFEKEDLIKQILMEKVGSRPQIPGGGQGEQGYNPMTSPNLGGDMFYRYPDPLNPPPLPNPAFGGQPYPSPGTTNDIGLQRRQSDWQNNMLRALLSPEQLIPSMPKTPEPFTLGPGQTRYGGGGQPLASVPSAQERGPQPTDFDQYLNRFLDLSQKDPATLSAREKLELQSLAPKYGPKAVKPISPSEIRLVNSLVGAQYPKDVIDKLDSEGYTTLLNNLGVSLFGERWVDLPVTEVEKIKTGLFGLGKTEYKPKKEVPIPIELEDMFKK